MTDLKPLTIQQLRYVSFIEEYYLNHKEFPPVGLLESHYGKSFNIKLLLKHPTFKLALENRGIPIPDPTSSKFPASLTDAQIAAVRLILDYNDKRSHRAKLQSLGITTIQWQGWLKNRVFKTFLHSLASEAFDESSHIASEGLVTALQRGDTSAIKLYYELTGKYTNNGEVLNTKLILAKIIESIQRHVKDPDTIRAIAQDFEVIMQGGTPIQSQEIKELI